MKRATEVASASSEEQDPVPMEVTDATLSAGPSQKRHRRGNKGDKTAPDSEPEQEGNSSDAAEARDQGRPAKGPKKKKDPALDAQLVALDAKMDRILAAIAEMKTVQAAMNIRIDNIPGVTKPPKTGAGTFGPPGGRSTPAPAAAPPSTSKTGMWF
jgi:hypothetical protein